MAYPFELKLTNYHGAAFSVFAADKDRATSTDPGDDVRWEIPEFHRLEPLHAIRKSR
jgi:hypothetical protein